MTTGSRAAPARRARFWSGVVLLVAGLAVLGYLGWQCLGTNVVSQHKQQQLLDQLHDGWQRPAGSEAPPATTGPGGASAILRVPRFGKKYAVPVVEGISPRRLSAGLGHFPSSDGPGAVGNFAVAGHRITNGQPLRNLDSLRPGDKILVETREANYTYVLDTDPNQLTVGNDQNWVVSAAPVNPVPSGPRPAAGQTKLITLVTCAELFHTRGRMVAFGHLVSVSPKT